LAIHKPTQKYVAIKKYTFLFASAYDTKTILRNIKVMRKLNHKNIVK